MEKISYGKFVSQVEAVPIYLCWQSSCDAHWRFFLGDSLSPTVETLASDILKMQNPGPRIRRTAGTGGKAQSRSVFVAHHSEQVPGHGRCYLVSGSAVGEGISCRIHPESSGLIWIAIKPIALSFPHELAPELSGGDKTLTCPSAGLCRYRPNFRFKLPSRTTQEVESPLLTPSSNRLYNMIEQYQAEPKVSTVHSF